MKTASTISQSKVHVRYMKLAKYEIQSSIVVNGQQSFAYSVYVHIVPVSLSATRSDKMADHCVIFLRQLSKLSSD